MAAADLLGQLFPRPGNFVFRSGWGGKEGVFMSGQTKPGSILGVGSQGKLGGRGGAWGGNASSCSMQG